MFNIRHWFVLFLLLFVNVVIFGCLLLLLMGKVVPFA